MGMGLDLQSYVDWAKTKSSRTAKIVVNEGRLTVWVYDYNLEVGLRVVADGKVIAADQIDLEAIKKVDEFRRYKELEKKYREVKE